MQLRNSFGPLGSMVNTKHGVVRTDHILFIAAGAFHETKVSDMIPELQGRFPIRVELDALGEEEFFRILSEPRNSLVTQYRELLSKSEYMDAHHDLRRKYFLPVRPLETYVSAIERAGFQMASSECRAIEARVDDWFRFLSVYHEGVLGWMGGAERITGKPVGNSVKADRLEMMREALDILFERRTAFQASWTYLKAIKPANGSGSL